MTASSNRIPFLDALRGIAALGVVLYHYGERIHWGNWGNMGVPMFFVLSGFVIAMSVGARPPVSAGYLGRFALRRALRLDPPYWLSMAAVIVIGLAAAHFIGQNVKPTTWPQVLTHLFYLQTFAGYEHLMVIYWTLCYEIQFYLVLIPLLWVGNRFNVVPLLMFTTMLLSLADRHFELTGVAFMGRFWFCFAAGAFVYWTTAGVMGARGLLTGLAIIGTAGALTQDPYAVTTMVTAATLYAVITFGRADIGSSAPLQFLGRISYSLYLTHLIGGWLVLTLALRYLPSWAALALGVVSSIVTAWIFYVLVEKPAVRLSRMVRLKPSPPQSLSAATPERATRP